MSGKRMGPEAEMMELAGGKDCLLAFLCMDSPDVAMGKKMTEAGLFTMSFSSSMLTLAMGALSALGQSGPAGGAARIASNAGCGRDMERIALMGASSVAQGRYGIRKAQADLWSAGGLSCALVSMGFDLPGQGKPDLEEMQARCAHMLDAVGVKRAKPSRCIWKKIDSKLLWDFAGSDAFWVWAVNCNAPQDGIWA